MEVGAVPNQSLNRTAGGAGARPSAMAVLGLIISSNAVGCSTGRSAGFSP
jgi:hypothetical protein